MVDEFERQDRYIVLKRKDVAKYLTSTEASKLAELQNKIYQERIKDGRTPFKCVVVEHDWLEYEPTWNAIERRVTNKVQDGVIVEIGEHTRDIKIFDSDGKNLIDSVPVCSVDLLLEPDQLTKVVLTVEANKVYIKSRLALVKLLFKKWFKIKWKEE